MALPVLLGPDDGERRQARGSVMVFKALAATTGGRFSLMERSLPPGARMPPPHRHVDCEEAFYVLEGEITFVLDGVEHVRGPGDFVLVPGGGSHTFGNRSAAPAPAHRARPGDGSLLCRARAAVVRCRGASVGGRARADGTPRDGPRLTPALTAVTSLPTRGGDALGAAPDGGRQRAGGRSRERRGCPA